MQRDSFSGVTVYRGSIVHCRDPSAYEMLMKVNRDFNGSVVKAVFPSTEISRTLFVAETTGFRDAVNAWLNPLHRGSRKAIPDLDAHSTSSSDEE